MMGFRVLSYRQLIITYLVSMLYLLFMTLAHAGIITTNVLALYGTAKHVHTAYLPYANPQAPKGGEFSTAAQGTFDSLNALINQGTSAEGTAYLSDSLLTSSLDEPFVSYGLLADHMMRDSNDSSWIIFHINPKAYFSNHRPVTADDVVFTFDTILNQGAFGLRAYFADIRHVAALDKNTVRFDFKIDPSTVSKNAQNFKIARAVGQMPILSRQDWQQRRFDQVSMTPPLGSGPYLVDQVDAGRSITYRRNPDYWARDLPVNRGRYNFDRIKYVYYRDPDAAFQGFKVGQYTFRTEQQEHIWFKDYDFAAVKQGSIIKQTIPNQSPIAMKGLVFNLRQTKFKDLRVRQALTLAFDFEWLNKALLHNADTRLQSYFFNSELEAKGAPTPAEMHYLQPLLASLSRAEQQAVLTPWQAPVSDGKGFDRANLLAARQLLLEAGYHYTAGQLQDSQGQPYRLTILIQDVGLQRMLLPYMHNLQRLGITTTIQVVDTPQYLERTRRFDEDMIVDSFPQTLAPGSEQQGYWGSQAAEVQGSLNTAGIRNPVIDQLLTQLTQTHERQEIVTITHALDRVLRAGYYMVPLYGYLGNRVAYWNQYRMPTDLPLYDLGLDYWWIDPTAERHIAHIIGQS